MQKQNNPYQEFQTWYDEYFSFIYLFLVGYFEKRHIPIRDSEIEDLVQNTFLAILERKTNTPIEFPLAYLKQTAISQARLCIDKKQKDYKLDITTSLQHTAPNQRLEQEESEQQIWSLIKSTLNPIESKLIFQRIVKGYSYKEIAAQEDMPHEQHLHSMYHRAKAKLHQHLKNIGFDNTPY